VAAGLEQRNLEACDVLPHPLELLLGQEGVAHIYREAAARPISDRVSTNPLSHGVTEPTVSANDGILGRGSTELIRVVVVDDHDVFRRGLAGLLREHSLDVVGEAATGEEAVALVAGRAPDVVVMDLNLPGKSGIEAIRELASSAPQTRVLVLTISGGDAEVTEAILAGACGYLLKDASIGDILSGVTAAAAGESLLSPKVAARLLDRIRTSSGDAYDARAELSEREVEVLRRVAQGKDNPEIAEELFISPKTVKNHISNILAKLQIENRIQAAVYAVRRGIV
jgi:DNA-binding NarL/FixJ family response regulator